MHTHFFFFPFCTSPNDFFVKKGLDRLSDYRREKPKPEMNENSWNITPSQAAARDMSREDHWRNFDNSVNAVSFGFVATAILISMFLVMAIFERFLRPSSSSSSAEDAGNGNRPLEPMDVEDGMQFFDKLDDSSTISTYCIGVSVVMPGQDIPTFIAHPVPLPCPPEGISWPLHEGGYFLGSSSCDARSSPIDKANTGESTTRPRSV